MDGIYIYKSNGFYLGFIKNGYLYSRDGIYLGWLEGNIVWDAKGQFRGTIADLNNHKYILTNRFTLSPASRTPKEIPSPTVPLTPQPNIAPISLSVEFTDGF